ncbi:hypothetical protein TNIN_470531 [Trichonephila inaurata madagascariensis]|uniref:Uncharacterized protein n=1 Tax=Trichonephila inaurata madagascariensis TaxID=2747483 RepID=A0A8X6YT54_9ARAC|nr:hypothetical protein TNIN_470531 [Trichonephila inaurata madagascariensis]
METHNGPFGQVTIHTSFLACIDDGVSSVVNELTLLLFLGWDAQRQQIFLRHFVFGMFFRVATEISIHRFQPLNIAIRCFGISSCYFCNFFKMSRKGIESIPESLQAFHNLPSDIELDESMLSEGRMLYQKSPLQSSH